MKIHLPQTHAVQREIIQDETRFKVWAAGRRSGKSTACLLDALDRSVNRGQRVWWVSLTNATLRDQWAMAERMVGHLATTKNVQDKYMRFEFDGRFGELSFKSAERPNNSRGSGLDHIVIDEAAFMRPEIWTNVLRPSLTDRHGSALIISTPNPNDIFNWFYLAFLRGKDETEPEWKSWAYPTTVNTFIPDIAAEVAQAKKDLPDLQFRIEYLAEFVSDAGGVFRNIEKVANVAPIDGPISGHTYVLGADFGRKNDFTVFSIVDITTSEQVYIERFPDIGFELQKHRLYQLHEKWNFLKMYLESNSFGMPLVEEVTAKIGDDIVEAVYMNNEIKNLMTERTALLIEKEELHLLDINSPLGFQQVGELHNIQISKTVGGTSVRYAAAGKHHDDMYIALILSCRGLNRIRGMKFSVKANPFYR